MIGCPPRAQLSDLILGTLTGEAADSVTLHVGSCTECQSSLQTIASGEIPVEKLVSDSIDIQPQSDSAYWNVIGSAGVSANPVAAKNPSDIHDPDLRVTKGIDQSKIGTDAMFGAAVQDGELSFLSPSDDPDSLGKLQHFEISRIIGRGGMGVVLDAFDTHLHRRVAIKVLNPRFQQDEIARQRFCREGRAAAAISHEHVVPMYQVARLEEEQIAYLVMQLIKGQTLEERLKETSPLPPQEVARIGMQIAAGLSAAHASGMVHRDIKPANVLIEADTERVKLTDFGLARVTDEVKLTQTGILTGTVLYMSPEQALGQETDDRSDLFSLGAVMYEMATGIAPFEAPTAVGVMKRIMDEKPPSPRKVNPQVGKPLSDLIMSLISKSPDKRPDSAAPVARALASIVSEHGPISPLQVPAVASSEVRKLSGSHSANGRRWSFSGWLAAGVMAALLAASALGGGWAWINGDGRTSRSNVTNGVSVELKDADNRKTDVTAQFPSVVLKGNPGTVWSVDFAPAGKSIVAGIEDGSVRVWDLASQKLQKSFSAHRGIVWIVRFHPTRNLVATAGDDGLVKLWDSKTFELKQEWQADNSVRGISFSPDGNTLLAGDRAGKLHFYDLETGAEFETILQSGSVMGLNYSPDGKSFATVGSDKIVRVFDAETFDQRQAFSGHEGPIYNVAFAPKGSLLASVGWNKQIMIWNVETGEKVMQLEGAEGDNWGVQFCGFGTHLVTGGMDGAARLWDVSTGTNTATLRGHSAAVHNIALDPNTHSIATSSRDGTIRIWDMSALDDKTKKPTK
ncbi:WD40 repeat domain-containing serine/threonine protein kinase [Mariniblastus fucicola]|uniref:non-specific serine/threonine protein kinase n=1 Tax=Mariniblastus fucicola TaxID=980251 RepID=A0A5B9PBM1_9BACT|nr:serine/threonine-protein kinase [Mariniblastus fucicola]QEG22849.1 Serine/threonine-protein kinase PrkC [Mariniblastus fucicola]